MNKNKLAILGGTGKAGTFLVRKALSLGYQVRLLVRKPEKVSLTNARLEIVQGDALEKSSLTELLKGCGVLISTMGTTKGDLPLPVTVTQNLLAAMQEQKVTRYIVLMGLTIDVPGDEKGAETKALGDWVKATFPEVSKNKQEDFSLISASELDWTVVRSPNILVEEGLGSYRTSLLDAPGKTILAGDLADVLLDQIEGTEFLRKAPFVAN